MYGCGIVFWNCLEGRREGEFDFRVESHAFEWLGCNLCIRKYLIILTNEISNWIYILQWIDDCIFLMKLS